MIHVNRAGSNLGIFSEEDVRAGLRSGQFAPTDLGWREGMDSWKPLAEFPEFAAESPGGVPPSAPPLNAPPIAADSVHASGARPGLPWEQRQTRGFSNAFGDTLVMVLLRPGEAFSVMRREGGFAEPLIYALIGGCAGAIISLLFSFILQSVGFSMGHHDTFATLAGLGISWAFLIVLMPFIVMLGLFLGAVIFHVCLMLVGGAKQPFETTFRVVAFSQGSTGILQIIPFCGGFIAVIWALVVQIIGLARAHDTDTARAAVAVFLPAIVCCGGGILLAVMFGALGVLGHHG